MSSENKQDYINNSHDKQIATLEGHARVANEEMGFIKTDMAILKKDIADIKKWSDSLDYKVWAIILALITALLRLFIR